MILKGKLNKLLFYFYYFCHFFLNLNILKIKITPQKSTELEDWLIRVRPEPTWLNSAPKACVYVLYSHNDTPLDCCDSNSLIISKNGHSIKIGRNLRGQTAAIKINYDQEPRPFGSDDKVLPSVIRYAIFFYPSKEGKTTKDLKKELKEKAKALIEKHFKSVKTISRDWIPFEEGNGEPCNIIDFLDRFSLTHFKTDN